VNSGTLGIVGTGLIGGSVGAAARRGGWHVLGCDARPESAAEALEVGAIDEVCTREELYARSDVVVIAAYVDGTIDELRRLAVERPSHPRVIIDVASVKRDVTLAGRDVPRFIPAHPMAGTEHSGAKHARGDLFDGRTWAYTPIGDADAEDAARAFISSLGAAPLAIDAEAHDRIVARTSHVPQLVASAFATQMREAIEDPGAFDALCGTTARELMRLGSASVAIWRTVLPANAEHVIPELRSLATRLEFAADALERGDMDAIATMFARARGEA
jgi:prephenate dehydrogenase